ncbi:hypothetical protein [Nitrospira sp. BLG_2]|uniref:hypothetical protein n=1 Tax=Nitrospira sp. BLG_2 TaxID=3397507 RepID=UPI003B9994AC
MKLIRDFGSTGYWHVVVLDTPAWPSRYYAGYAKDDLPNGDWRTYSNAGCYYYKTKEEAEQAATAIVPNRASNGE